MAAGGCSFGDTQHQIVVLRTVETGTEAPDLRHCLSAQDGQMARVHAGAEPLGRPGWLGERHCDVAREIDVGFVGVEVVDRGDRFVERGEDGGEDPGLQCVVVVDKHDVLAGQAVECIVAGGNDSTVLGALHDGDARVTVRFLEDRVHFGAARPIVDQ